MDSKSKTVKEYFNKTHNYLTNNLVIDIRSNLINTVLKDLENRSILDIGCGNGKISMPYIQKNNISFLDFSENMLNQIKSNIDEEHLSKAAFINADISSYESTTQYDYIFLIGVIAHLSSINSIFIKLNKFLKEDGTLILQYTNKHHPISFLFKLINTCKSIIIPQYGYKVNYVSSKGIQKMLLNNNFISFKSQSYWAMLPGLTFLPLRFRSAFYFNIINSKYLKFFGGEKILYIKKRCI